MSVAFVQMIQSYQYSHIEKDKKDERNKKKLVMQ